jgi:hypothetical protein
MLDRSAQVNAVNRGQFVCERRVVEQGRNYPLSSL